jgi:L-malate glycosyltransferase
MTARRLRILHVDHTGVVGGAEHSLLALIGELHGRHDLLLAAPAGPLLERAERIGIATARLPPSDASWRMHPRRTPRALGALAVAGVRVRALARRGQIDVVHANSVRAGLIAAVARVLGGPPVVVHVRDRLGSGWARTLVKLVLGAAAARIVVVSRFTAADWAAVPLARGRIVQVANPIDCESFAPDPADGRAWRAAQGVPADAALLAVVGQITPWKRQDLALRVAAGLREQLPAIRLVIAGEVKFATPGTAHDNPAYDAALGRLHEQLRLEDVASFIGERDDVPSLLRAADVVLAPARDEPFGRVVGEALAGGTPVVVPRRGGPAEIVRDGIDGVIVRSDDTAAWQDATLAALELAADPAGAARRSDHARAQLSSPAHGRAMESILVRATR